MRIHAHLPGDAKVNVTISNEAIIKAQVFQLIYWLLYI